LNHLLERVVVVVVGSLAFWPLQLEYFVANWAQLSLGLVSHSWDDLTASFVR